MAVGFYAAAILATEYFRNTFCSSVAGTGGL
jgi:hypothetical protein